LTKAAFDSKILSVPKKTVIEKKRKREEDFMESVMELSNTACASAVPVIGKMLLAGEYIVPQDLEFALEHQRHSQEPLGEILVHGRPGAGGTGEGAVPARHPLLALITGTAAEGRGHALETRHARSLTGFPKDIDLLHPAMPKNCAVVRFPLQ
jgi:hypothetical protein